jgi:NTE family protein
VLERIRNHDDKGVYLTIGRDCPSVIAAAGKSQELSPLYRDSLTSEEADHAGDFPTVIRKLTDAEFELLFRHGFEIADCTLHAYYPDLFGHIAYQPSG